MKITHIVLLLLVAGMVGVIVGTSGDTSQYVNFAEAKVLAQVGGDDLVHVVGELVRDAQGEPVDMQYDPMKSTDYFYFTATDEQKNVLRVKAKVPPSMTDFKRSEKVVMEGRFVGEQFVCEKLLLKCPSKYEEKQI